MFDVVLSPPALEREREDGRPDPDGARLVAALVAGSSDALAALYDRHARSVFRVALAIARDESVAEEVVQDTFLALWNHAEAFDPAVGSLRAWLSAIARNRSIDHIRSRARRAPSVPFSVVVGDRPDEAATVEWLASTGGMIAAAEPDPGPDEMLFEAETRRTVTAALDVLNDDERQVILLAYRHGLSQSEIATVLGWPLGTVKTRSRRALQRLRVALGDEPGYESVPLADGAGSEDDAVFEDSRCG